MRPRRRCLARSSGTQHVLAVILLRKSVLSHLEKVQALPVEVQADIARGVDNYIKIAKAAKDDALVERSLPLPWKCKPRQLGRESTHVGSAMGCTGNCRGMVLCHDQSVQGLPKSIARGSDHRRN